MVERWDGEQISVGRSTSVGLLKALSLGALPAALVHYITNGMSDRVDISLTLLGYGLAAAAAFKAMEHAGVVNIGSYGLHTVQGGVTGKVFGPGEHPLIPGLEGIVEVNARDKPLNPPAFEELAKDLVPVFVDGYFVVKVADPVLFYTSVDEEEAHAALKTEFDSEIRLFVNQWNRASDLVSMKELLTKFMKLNGGLSEDEAARKLKAELMLLTPVHGRDMLSVDGVENIMEDAGNFCRTAAKWGYVISQIHIEKVALPVRLTAAAEAASAARDAMKPSIVKQEVRLQMMDELKQKYPSLSDREIKDAVDLGLGIPVNRQVNEVEVKGISIPPEIVEAAASLAARIRQKG